MEGLLQTYGKSFAVGVLCISTLLMGYVIYEISFAKQQFANRLITASVTQSESELDNFFERVNNLIYSVGHQYQSGFWDGLDQQKKMLHSISLIKHYEPISSIGIADLRGYELNILPELSSSDWFTREVFVDRWGNTARWSRWSVGDTLVREDQWESVLPIDPKERPWFKGAVRAKGEVFWTEPYEYTTGPEIGITASKLYESEVDSLSRIIAFDLTLNDLNEFIQDLDLTDQQGVYILDANLERVIAFQAYSKNPGLDTLNLENIASLILPSPDELSDDALSYVLSHRESNRAFRFTLGGESWWGIVRPYQISNTQLLNIVSILPESDFSMEIDRTSMVGVGSFLLILVLTFLVVWNHNKLHRFSRILAEKNEVILEQKDILFSEVHHRVKNNLAVISAFLELDLFALKDLTEVPILKKNMKRIKIIALIQEEIYKSETLGMVSLQPILERLVKHHVEFTHGLRLHPDLDEIQINVNQAMTFGILLHEILSGLNSVPEVSDRECELRVTQLEKRVTMTLRVEQREPVPESCHRVIESDVVQALSRQLSAEVSLLLEPALMCQVTFDLKDRKGVVSSRPYT